MITSILYAKRTGPNGTVSYDSHYIWSKERFIKNMLEECAKQNEDYEKEFKTPGMATFIPVTFQEYIKHKGTGK